MRETRSYIETAKASRPRQGFIPNPELKLLDQVSEVMRFKHCSFRTETPYLVAGGKVPMAKAASSLKPLMHTGCTPGADRNA